MSRRTIYASVTLLRTARAVEIPLTVIQRKTSGISSLRSSFAYSRSPSPIRSPVLLPNRWPTVSIFKQRFSNELGLRYQGVAQFKLGSQYIASTQRTQFQRRKAAEIVLSYSNIPGYFSRRPMLFHRVGRKNSHSATNRKFKKEKQRK